MSVGRRASVQFECGRFRVIVRDGASQVHQETVRTEQEVLAVLRRWGVSSSADVEVLDGVR